MWQRKLEEVLFIFLTFIYLFIYLAVPGISCGMWDLF